MSLRVGTPLAPAPLLPWLERPNSLSLRIALRLDVSPEPTTGALLGAVVTKVPLSTLCASVGDAVASLTVIRHLPVPPGIYPDGHVHVLGLSTRLRWTLS